MWVNVPTAEHNKNFVLEPPNILDRLPDGFFIRGSGLESPASVWLPPLYHDQNLSAARPANQFVFTHGDRVRLSPLRGCAMRCTFCNIPYQDRYGTKSIEPMIEALQVALADPLQPAHHILISGGTPLSRDIPLLREVYERVLLAFPHHQVDIMMVPVDGLFDLLRLKTLGLHELAINIELFNTTVAADLMPQKAKQGLMHYLNFIAEATDILGPQRVRSMMMVGLEPMEDTLAGIQSIIQAGGVPVLSPFRPDPATPLRDIAPLSGEEYEEIFLRATELAANAGVQLGPSCPPCTHNTLTLASTDRGGAKYPHPVPALV